MLIPKFHLFKTTYLLFMQLQVLHIYTSTTFFIFLLFFLKGVNYSRMSGGLAYVVLTGSALESSLAQ
ncbi:hypothetical protein Hanom_Chr17g01591861 [Helianthus anomalus]